MRQAARYAEQRLYRFLPYALGAIVLAFLVAVSVSHAG